MKPVWIVDDDRSIRWVLEKALERDGISYESFVSAPEVLQAIGSGDPCVLVSDIRMPGESGLVLLEKVKERYPRLPVIIMTAYSDLDSAVAAFQGGAFEYLPKPFDVDHAVALIRRAMAESCAQTPVETASGASAEMLGQAPAMQEVFRAIGRLSQSSATVLITGESGTGKELVARALHRHSPRAAGPFIAINTAAIPKDLLESELFGHERGAFTGAQSARRGRFEQAEGGTLFLDEIGDMPSDLQVRLLRVLESRRVSRVGSSETIPVNVRVIAATNRDPQEAVHQRKLREDLLYRLQVVPIEVPPLRKRAGDVRVLAQHFLSDLNRASKDPKSFSESMLARLEQHYWPGNVRELFNVVQRAYIMTTGRVISDPGPLQGPGWSPATGRESPLTVRLGDSLCDVEQRLILHTVRHCRTQDEAARMLGISTKTLYNKLRLYESQRRTADANARFSDTRPPDSRWT